MVHSTTRNFHMSLMFGPSISDIMENNQIKIIINELEDINEPVTKLIPGINEDLIDENLLNLNNIGKEVIENFINNHNVDQFLNTIVTTFKHRTIFFARISKD